jgi:hypothetical protein
VSNGWRVECRRPVCRSGPDLLNPDAIHGNQRSEHLDLFKLGAVVVLFGEYRNERATSLDNRVVRT